MILSTAIVSLRSMRSAMPFAFAATAGAPTPSHVSDFASVLMSAGSILSGVSMSLTFLPAYKARGRALMHHAGAHACSFDSGTKPRALHAASTIGYIGDVSTSIRSLPYMRRRGPHRIASAQCSMALSYI